MVKIGLLIISHGSRSDTWVQLVDEAVTAAGLPEDVPVFSSFLEIVEGRLIQDGIDALEAQGVTDIVVIPLFVSSGSTHIDEISYALGVIPAPQLPTDMGLFRVKARIHFGQPIDDDPDIAQLLADKIAPLSVQPDRELVLLVGHGSVENGFHERWKQGLEQLAARMKALGGFAEADVAMLLPDQARARMAYWQERRPELDVIVSPLFLSEGYFTNEVIPERLEGFAYRYNGASLLPHPLISRWIERQFAVLAASYSHADKR
ncbi:sirohydrochlorin chelatase [Paenibacillus sp. y28]|uniref:sirohydrochlorin chelatase n=1 Tax=Paenibacillus sp. y28 TaxID=3129110 RepID=UPI003019E202